MAIRDQKHAQGIRTITVNGYTFDWAGGPYIEITRPGETEPIEVINVAADQLEFTDGALRKAIDQWRINLNASMPGAQGWKAHLESILPGTAYAKTEVYLAERQSQIRAACQTIQAIIAAAPDPHAPRVRALRKITDQLHRHTNELHAIDIKLWA
ncbi:hypothetical protein [Mycobacteroides abscessus]|uniref:hypothetical protein n=1 Tax=Mycobacteroides abscessus TaxID=36809 RepID=UPI000C266FAF|nr:hypothetical protein [Mycobacteroides abscessus]